MGEWPPENRFTYVDVLWTGDLDRFKEYDVPDDIVDGCLATVISCINRAVYAVKDTDLAEEEFVLHPAHRRLVDHLILQRGSNMSEAVKKFTAGDVNHTSCPEVMMSFHHQMRFLDIEEETDA